MDVVGTIASVLTITGLIKSVYRCVRNSEDDHGEVEWLVASLKQPLSAPDELTPAFTDKLDSWLCLKRMPSIVDVSSGTPHLRLLVHAYSI